jgi:hypothetical protein
VNERDQKSSWSSTDLDRRNRRSIVIWSLLWVGAFLVADAAIDRGWIEGDAGVVVASIGTALVGLAWIVSYMRFLRHADELMRKIQLDAMALALGGCFVAGFTLILLGGAGLVQAGIVWVLVVTSAIYMLSVLIGIRRFGG